MKKNIWRAVIEVGFIIFLFYSNLLMGEFERSGMGQKRGVAWAIGDILTAANFEIAYDPIERTVPMHPEFEKALRENKEAKKVFDSLRPSLQLEINRYFSFLKSESAIDRNVTKAIQFLLGKGRFVARDKPN